MWIAFTIGVVWYAVILIRDHTIERKPFIGYLMSGLTGAIQVGLIKSVKSEGYEVIVGYSIGCFVGAALGTQLNKLMPKSRNKNNGVEP